MDLPPPGPVKTTEYEVEARRDNRDPDGRFYQQPYENKGVHACHFESGEFAEQKIGKRWYACQVVRPKFIHGRLLLYEVLKSGMRDRDVRDVPAHHLRDPTPAPDITQGDIVETYDENYQVWLPGIVREVRYVAEHLYSFIVRRLGQFESDHNSSWQYPTVLGEPGKMVSPANDVEVLCPYDTIRRMVPPLRRNPWLVM